MATERHSQRKAYFHSFGEKGHFEIFHSFQKNFIFHSTLSYNVRILHYPRDNRFSITIVLKSDKQLVLTVLFNPASALFPIEAMSTEMHLSFRGGGRGEYSLHLTRCAAQQSVLLR